MHKRTGSRRRPSHFIRPRVELLEARRVLSGSVQFQTDHHILLLISEPAQLAPAELSAAVTDAVVVKMTANDSQPTATDTSASAQSTVSQINSPPANDGSTSSDVFNVTDAGQVRLLNAVVETPRALAIRPAAVDTENVPPITNGQENTIDNAVVPDAGADKPATEPRREQRAEAILALARREFAAEILRAAEQNKPQTAALEQPTVGVTNPAMNEPLSAAAAEPAIPAAATSPTVTLALSAISEADTAVNTTTEVTVGDAATLAEAPEATSFAGRVSELLTGAVALDLSAVDQGMKKFLAGLDRLGAQVTAGASGTGASTWLMAVALAGVGCEVARRQLQRSSLRLALANGGNDDTTSWLPALSGPREAI